MRVKRLAASSGVRNLPRHGLKTQSVPLMKPKEKQDRFAHHLKVANRSFVVSEGSPARCVSEREKGGDHAPGDSKGRSPWRAFGDFPRDGKVTRGRRGGAPSLLRAWELCSHFGECRGVHRRCGPSQGWSAEEGSRPPRISEGAAGATVPCKSPLEFAEKRCYNKEVYTLPRHFAAYRYLSLIHI